MWQPLHFKVVLPDQRPDFRVARHQGRLELECRRNGERRRQFVVEVGPADRKGLYKLSLATVSGDGRQYAYQYVKDLSTLFVVSGVK